MFKTEKQIARIESMEHKLESEHQRVFKDLATKEQSLDRIQAEISKAKRQSETIQAEIEQLDEEHSVLLQSVVHDATTKHFLACVQAMEHARKRFESGDATLESVEAHRISLREAIDTEKDFQHLPHISRDLLDRRIRENRQSFTKKSKQAQSLESNIRSQESKHHAKVEAVQKSVLKSEEAFKLKELSIQQERQRII